MKVDIWGGRAGTTLPFVIQGMGAQYRAGQRVLLLVPEQYTLQAERELVERLDLPGFLDMEVLSPSRLRRRIREQGGRDAIAPLDSRGSSMVISQALALCRDDLHYYRRVATAPSLPDKIVSLLTDMRHAGLDPASLRETADGLGSAAARAKLHDLCHVWSKYNELIDGRFADEAAQQAESLRRLAPSGVVTGVHVWVYGFDVLQQPFCELLAGIAPLAASLTVTMTMDGESAPDGRIFLAQRRSAARLTRLMADRGIDCTLKFLPPQTEGRAPALMHLEKHLFARQRPVFTGDASPLRLHACATPFAEAAFAAKTLRAWHDAGIPWHRMAVALAAPGSTALAMTLEAAGIPYYMARKDSVVRHGLCRMLLGAVHAATEGFRQADVLEAARSGFSPLTPAEAETIENYAIENGIDRKKWMQPFTRGDAETAEPLRQRLIAPMEALGEALRQAKTATESLTALYRLLEDVQAYDRLLAREEELLRRGMAAEAAQNRQVWQLLLGLMDQLHALLGDSRALLKDIPRLVESGLVGATVSALPPSRDTVMVGEAGHLMPGALDALLLMGMQDGVLGSSMNSLLSDRERETLSAAVERPVGVTRQEQGALRLTDFYKTLALPTQQLTVTFAQGGQDGAALRPAAVIGDMQQMYPGLVITGGVTATEEDTPLAPLPAIETLALKLRAMADGEAVSMDASWQEALRWLWHSRQYGGMTRQMIASLGTEVSAEHLNKQAAARLFGQDSVSISRLEEFAECPYRHFVDYGLKPVIRREYAFQPDEKGSFFHEALQGYATLASAMPNWPNIPDADVDRMMDQVLSPLTEAWAGGPLREDPMGMQLGQSYVKAIRRAAKMFTSHARNSRFTPWGAEVAFGREGGLPPVVLTLQDGKQVALRGVIDRIDRYEGDGGLYLRVVDYKSSRHKLEPVRMWYGLQLQLLLYLQAAVQGVADAKPAGAFYFTVRDPMVDSESDVKEAAERAIAKELRLKGVVLAETEVVRAMDFDEPEFSLEKVFNANGTVAAKANAVNLEEMHALLDHAQKTAADLTDHIREGQIDVAPASCGDWNACQWCDYASVCRRDPRLPGGDFRELSDMNREEFAMRLANSSLHAGEKAEN